MMRSLGSGMFCIWVVLAIICKLMKMLMSIVAGDEV